MTDRKNLQNIVVDFNQVVKDKQQKVATAVKETKAARQEQKAQPTRPH